MAFSKKKKGSRPFMPRGGRGRAGMPPPLPNTQAALPPGGGMGMTAGLPPPLPGTTPGLGSMPGAVGERPVRAVKVAKDKEKTAKKLAKDREKASKPLGRR